MFTNAPERAARVSLPGSTADVEHLRQAALWLLPRVWQPAAAAVHYMHVIAGKLRPYACRQRGLFEAIEEQDERIADVKRRINHVVGRFALRSGATLPLAHVHRDPANDYDICDIYGKSCF